MTGKQPCMEEGCDRKKYRSFHRCVWHWLLTQPIEEGVRQAHWRRENSTQLKQFGRRIRVPESEWPAGTRWCSGCQSYVPLFYVSNTRCKACESEAKHASHAQRTYGLSPEDYRALYDWQSGRCFICGRAAISARLAIDHDHVTGAVRGLLCRDPDRGCNKAILGNLEASARNPLDAALRLVAYLRLSPLERMRRGDPGPGVAARQTKGIPELLRDSTVGPVDLT